MCDADFVILGVSKKNSKSEIKKAYLNLMLKYHPDKVGEKYEEQCKEINKAYENIMNKEYNEDAMIPSGFRKMGFNKIPTPHEYITQKIRLNPNIYKFSLMNIINDFLWGTTEIILHKI